MSNNAGSRYNSAFTIPTGVVNVYNFYVQLDSGNIENLFTTPIQLLGSAGQGYTWMPLMAYAEIFNVVTPYTAPGARLAIYQDSATIANYIFGSSNNIIVSHSNKSALINGTQSIVTDFLFKNNASLQIASTAAISGGNATIRIYGTAALVDFIDQP